MHISLVSETYPPEINGVSLTVQALAAGLVAAGHRVELVRPRQKIEADAAEAGMEVRRMRGLPLPRYPGLQLGLPCRHRLQRQWRKDRPDAVYVATEGPLGGSALTAARRLGIPAISGFHTRFDTYAGHYGVAWLRPMVEAWLRRFHLRSLATLVPTQALAAEIAAIGIDNARLLRRAVDTRLFCPEKRDPALRRDWQADEASVVVLFVGRIAPEKNLDLAIHSWQAIRAACPGSRCVWVGDGPARAELERAHPEIHFTGMLRGEALARHYASADVFPFPSMSETFGNVVLEALASGLGVIAYDQAAAHEHMVDGENGSLVSSGDAGRFVESCLELATDPARRRACGRQARASVANLAPQRVIAEFAAILASVSHGNDHVIQTAPA
ncbi:glycosyltransferase family 4 protein [Frateuria aurantia]|uniref:Glycosyltransferase n=1 Tax=Frateuria aurantia (strain ATCC 33424 / DSM 6220 / KCTC 2777 / LMG 1558 / NBRC 3245 / NCIMB 13370) TaxID=767434 RepID=H8L1N1_FRAAD|nr:glycosyltransferase family 1 protein [Frateuria aurantia]AFC85391.1 glycosyltransferase [Frateuria aurantia DSM 6220]